jgi:type II secretory pathway predicted ATPase ExeA
MIRAAFNLTELPFSKEIDASRLFMHPQFQEFTARLQLLCNNRGIGLFTGEVGCGKSTAIRSVLEGLSPQAVMKLHRGLGLAGVLSGAVHGLIYWLFLR